MTIRVSNTTYYSTTGRFRDNKGKPKKTNGGWKRTEARHYNKFAECSCTKEILLEKENFVDHCDTWNNYCEGSGQHKDFWKY